MILRPSPVLKTRFEDFTLAVLNPMKGMEGPHVPLSFILLIREVACALTWKADYGSTGIEILHATVQSFVANTRTLRFSLKA